MAFPVGSKTLLALLRRLAVPVTVCGDAPGQDRFVFEQLLFWSGLPKVYTLFGIPAIIC
jgi:hypothetical protein